MRNQFPPRSTSKVIVSGERGGVTRFLRSVGKDAAGWVVACVVMVPNRAAAEGPVAGN